MDLPNFDHQVKAAVIECGLKESEFELKYKDYLQSHELTIDTSGKIPESGSFACIWNLEKKYSLVVSYRDREAMIAFWNYKSPILTSDHREAAAMRLKELGLLTKVPTFEPETEELIGFIRKIEVLCDVEPGAMLKIFHENLITLRPSFAADIIDQQHSRVFQCAMDIIAVSNLSNHDISFGFIGNEAPSEETNK